MIWNKKGVRIAVGVLLLGCGILAMLPSITGYTSLAGTVNARFVIIASPIEGTVEGSPHKAGNFVQQDASLVEIRNDRISQTPLVNMRAEREVARQQLDALDGQHDRLALLESDLQKRLDAYQHAAVQNLQHDVAIQEEQIQVANAKQAEAQADLFRKERLRAGGLVAAGDYDRSRAATQVSQHESEQSVGEFQLTQEQLSAAQEGIYLGQGRNDAPYSEQRKDEVRIALADVDSRRKVIQARLTQLDLQVAAEEKRIEKLSFAAVQSPLTGVIWRNSVVQGSNVLPGTELMRVLDCRDMFVDILVPEVDYDQIYPGRTAQVRLLGNGQTLKGVVQSVRGSAADVEEPTLAANPPKGHGRNARIRVQLQNSALNTDYKNFCEVGRSAQVRFRTKRLALTRWVKALWFSVQ